MPYADAGGVKLYYERCGEGTPVIFVHEFAGDHRSWEPQMRAFSRSYDCIAYSARGYPPSDVPDDPADYAQAIVADDIGHVLDACGVARAHVVGLSMGGFATLHFGLRHPERAVSLVIAGCGYGAARDSRAQFEAEVEAVAARYDRDGAAATAEIYGSGPTRVQFQNKNPRGWAEFTANLAEHSAKGAANTLRGYQKLRPSLYDLEQDLRGLTVPSLIMVGDEDEPCLEPGLYLKRSIPSAGLCVLPKSGHTINLESPDTFNRELWDFLSVVEAGRWGTRDPRATIGGIMLDRDDDGA